MTVCGVEASSPEFCRMIVASFFISTATVNLGWKAFGVVFTLTLGYINISTAKMLLMRGDIATISAPYSEAILLLTKSSKLYPKLLLMVTQVTLFPGEDFRSVGNGVPFFKDIL